MLHETMERLERYGIWPGVAALGASLLWYGMPWFDPAWIAVLCCGLPILWTAGKTLRRLELDTSVLVATAIFAAVALGEIFAAGEVAVIMQMGEQLEHWTVHRAQEGLRRLLQLMPRTGRIIAADSSERMVAAEEIPVGANVRVLPGETVPADGPILTGKTSLDFSFLTGESLPVDLVPGDRVVAGAINRFGTFDFRAERVGSDATAGRMAALVAEADAGKARVVRLADRWARWIVPAALLTAVVVGLGTGSLLQAVTILVVFCPCALVVATPAAVTAAIGNASRHGALVRRGDALERLATVTAIALDKTGTLTLGEPTVTAIRPVPGVTSEHLLRVATAVERHSEHPLAKAIVAKAQVEGLELLEASDVRIEPGKGVEGVVAGQCVRVGRSSHRSTGSETVAEVLANGQRLGEIAFADSLRAESEGTLRALRKQGLEPCLLTGDNAASAARVAEALGIGNVRAACLPEDKLAYVQEHAPIVMVGDGINDAAALRAATVGVAMGRIGSDLAGEAADIVLVSDTLSTLPGLIDLSRATARTIRWNIALSLGINLAAIALATLSLLGPVGGAFVHNAGALLVVLNAARLLWRNFPRLS